MDGRGTSRIAKPRRRFCAAAAITLFCIGLASAAGAVDVPRIILIGDSIAAGTGLRRANRTLANRLERMLNVGVYDLTWLGATVTEKEIVSGSPTGLGHLERALSNLKVGRQLRAVVILAGTNDWLEDVNLAAFKEEYFRIASIVAVLDVPLICVTPTWRIDQREINAMFAHLNHYRIAIEAVCQKHVVVDGPSAIPAVPRYFEDGLRPNRFGVRRLAKRLATVIEPYLDDRVDP